MMHTSKREELLVLEFGLNSIPFIHNMIAQKYSDYSKVCLGFYHTF